MRNQVSQDEFDSYGLVSKCCTKCGERKIAQGNLVKDHKALVVKQVGVKRVQEKNLELWQQKQNKKVK